MEEIKILHALLLPLYHKEFIKGKKITIS